MAPRLISRLGIHEGTLPTNAARPTKLKGHDRKVHGKVKVMFKDKVVHTACPLLTNLLAVYGCWWMRFGALSEGLRACDFPLIVK